MGVIYSVYPLTDRSRLLRAEYGITQTGDLRNGRNPTVAEVRAILQTLPGFRADYEAVPPHNSAWGATIEDAVHPEEGPWAHLRTLHYQGEEEPTEIYFEKGWPSVIVDVVARLAGVCGTMLVLPDTGEAPVVVPEGADPDKLLRMWEHSNPELSAGGDEE